MCGIAGAVGFVDPAVLQAVRRMNDAQRHRGPDAEGIWHDIDHESGLGVVLGHRRLSIIDRSQAANQPMTDPATGNVISYNGEVYNFPELRAELRAGGVEFDTQSDTEVVLKSYARWGFAALHRLRGMFAFAVWDKQERRLCLARDRLGIKPLYVAYVERSVEAGTLFFASELRALLATGQVDARADPAGIATYLWNGFVVGPSTIVEGVRSLPAATVAFIEPSNPVRSREQLFWTLPGPQAPARDPSSLPETLAQATKMHLVSDVPVGVFLSGGIDSSSIASLAAQGTSKTLRTFTIRFPERQFDESPYARRVAQLLGTEHQEITLDESRFEKQLPAALGSLDQPTFDGLNTYFVSRAVRESGISVALAGTGGDELFGGYRSFRDLPRALRWSRRLSPFPLPPLRAAANAIGRLAMGAFGAVPPQTRWGKLGDVLSTRGDLVHLYQTAYGLFSQDFLASLAHIERRKGTFAGLPVDRYRELRARLPEDSVLHSISMLELWLFLGERLLRDTDAVSMAVSLEVRVPMLDHELVEHVSALPERMRFHPIGRKTALREAALSALPKDAFERPKMGFLLPIERWCRERLKGEVSTTLENRSRCESLGLNPDTVGGISRAFQAGAPGIYWSRLWSLFVLLEWCREHRVAL